MKYAILSFLYSLDFTNFIYSVVFLNVDLNFNYSLLNFLKLLKLLNSNQIS